ncbi:hypothetical protein C9374_008143 [Naegleria lovaniensis]|uniref:F-box domain-containing protein n=1 Tax=Naegleria lovaniensis TaxID=51637 RepID=A0AA88GFN8_NAELO|nr:uncharacterized protein C9374_008143 [Naegleria lovaniensis]KAG2378504.1 hypothetical protein C9374_008143 [Naegleria lovaniensis]
MSDEKYRTDEPLTIIFPLDLWLKIAIHLDLPALNALSQCHSHLFNFIMCRNLQKEKTLLFSLKCVFIDREKQQEDEIFQCVQQYLWKPLLIYYFPLFNKDLNVKNHMLVLKRRVKYISTKKPYQNGKIMYFQNHYGQMVSKFPEALVMDNDFVHNAKQSGLVKDEISDGFIENCEWIYKCPLNASEFANKFQLSAKCDVCHKMVYRVTTVQDFMFHTDQGHCVSFNTSLSKRPRGGCIIY